MEDSLITKNSDRLLPKNEDIVVPENLDQSDAAKISQLDAKYRQGSGEESCSVCVNFLPPNACRKVSGIIAPGGLSDLFQSVESNIDPLTSQIFSPEGLL